MGSWQITRSYSRPSEAKVAAGNRFARASIKLRAACWVSSAEDVLAWRSCAEKSTVLAMCSAAVDVA